MTPLPTPTKEEEDSTCLVSEKFPMRVLQWCDLITFHAHRKSLDPNLIASIILQESKGNPNAVGSSKEYGLMQIVSNENPRFPNRPSKQALLDPDFNIRWGTNYLSSLINRHGLWQGVRCYNSCTRPMNYYANKIRTIYDKHK